VRQLRGPFGGAFIGIIPKDLSAQLSPPVGRVARPAGCLTYPADETQTPRAVDGDYFITPNK
jgi:hypothetical protein